MIKSASACKCSMKEGVSTHRNVRLILVVKSQGPSHAILRPKVICDLQRDWVIDTLNPRNRERYRVIFSRSRCLCLAVQRDLLGWCWSAIFPHLRDLREWGLVSHFHGLTDNLLGTLGNPIASAVVGVPASRDDQSKVK